MTSTVHDDTVQWLHDYMKTHDEAEMSFREVRRQMRASGSFSLSCYLLDKRFLFGRLVREARQLEKK